MPTVDRHVQESLEKTGKDFREVHEWLDSDPEKKAQRHDITKIFEFGKEIEEKYGEEGRQEYLRHLQDDLKAKFERLQHDIEKSIAGTLAYFGLKRG